MNKDRLHSTAIAALLLLWLSIVYPLIKKMLGLEPIIFPAPLISQLEKAKFFTISSLLVVSLLAKALIVLKNQKNESIARKKIVPLGLIILISVPVALGYVFELDLQAVSQTILDLGNAVMDEDFDDIPPGEDPPGWEEESGDWYAVDDGGNTVYYNDDDGDAEALSISTTGNTSWTDYSFMVDVKFIEGPANKGDRAALLVFRYTSGNDYYFLAMREAQDELELYKHGVGGEGHLRGTVSCTLVQDTWYSVNVTIRGDNVWVSIDDTYYFSNLSMAGSHSQGSVGIGTEYYKVMFDNILVELRGN